MSNLSGKTALVTGASRGIGRASALALAKAGAQVLVHYSASEKEADAVVAEIRKDGGRAEKVGADLRQAEGPHILAKRVRAIVGDRLDVLVANAGISKAASIDGSPGRRHRCAVLGLRNLRIGAWAEACRHDIPANRRCRPIDLGRSPLSPAHRR